MKVPGGRVCLSLTRVFPMLRKAFDARGGRPYTQFTDAVHETVVTPFFLSNYFFVI